LPGEQVTYRLSLSNSGQLPASGVTLVDPIPQHTRYVPDSVTCSAGTCRYEEQANEIRWSGEIPGESQVALSFAVTLSSIDQDSMPIANEATLREASGSEHKLHALFVAHTLEWLIYLPLAFASP
jgi:uncharacterized repeat protein (TIGR01451 family)